MISTGSLVPLVQFTVSSLEVSHCSAKWEASTPYGWIKRQYVVNTLANTRSLGHTYWQSRFTDNEGMSIAGFNLTQWLNYSYKGYLPWLSLPTSLSVMYLALQALPVCMISRAKQIVIVPI